MNLSTSKKSKIKIWSIPDHISDAIPLTGTDHEIAQRIDKAFKEHGYLDPKWNPDLKRRETKYQGNPDHQGKLF